MILRRGVAVLALLVLGTSPSLSAPKTKTLSAPKTKACVTSEEKQALDSRVLQTELMVGGLSCGQQEQYNRFVLSFQPELQERGEALKKLFSRIHGRNAEDALNAFVTRLANDSSERSRNSSAEYCVFTWGLFWEAFGTPTTDYGKLTEKSWIAPRHGFPSCEGS